jgi:hypothetical protein
MDQSGASPETLHKRAVAMIVAGGRVPLDAVGTAAADLLTELYTVGVAHGISPDDWEAVTSLPLACLDVTRAQARRQRPIRDWDAPRTLGQPLALTPPPVQPGRSVDQRGRGRAR